jgi:metallophosphoesterase superfamily enzyme
MGLEDKLTGTDMTKNRNYKTAVVLADEHIPFMKQEMMNIARAYVADKKPEYRIHLGDIFDNPGCSDFDKDPKYKRDTQEEIDLAVQYLAEMHKASPKTKTILIAGNHDQGRISRAKGTYAFGLGSLRSLDMNQLILESAEQQGLEIGSIQFVRDFVLGPKSGGVYFTHGDPRMNKGIQGSAQLTATRHPHEGHIVIGHKHRAEEARDKFRARSCYVVAALLDPDHVQYVPNTQYENGMMVVHYNLNEKKPVFHINNHVMQPNNSILIDGKIYKG